MANYQRSPARFMFANELKQCSMAVTEGEGQFAAAHTISPTGEDIHRVFMVGVATEKEDIGNDNAYWRVRIVDSSGSILGYAGTYQPEAMLAADELDVPSFVALSGKMRLFTTEDGTVISSINLESIFRVEKDSMDLYTYFAARNLLTRLLQPDESNPAVAIARENYELNKEEYFEMVKNALESIKD